MSYLLVSLDDAKGHLRILNDDNDDDITAKIQEASAMVLRHAKLDIVPYEWYSGSPAVLDAPEWAKTATKLVLSELYENREASITNPLSDAVKSVIPRDPTLA